jgi:hypothetical protein
VADDLSHSPDTTNVKPDISIFTIGFRYFSQLHPGSNAALPMFKFPTVANSILPVSKVLVSSGEVRDFFGFYLKISLKCSMM